MARPEAFSQESPAWISVPGVSGGELAGIDGVEIASEALDFVAELQPCQPVRRDGGMAELRAEEAAGGGGGGPMVGSERHAVGEVRCGQSAVDGDGERLGGDSAITQACHLHRTRRPLGGEPARCDNGLCHLRVMVVGRQLLVCLDEGGAEGRATGERRENNGKVAGGEESIWVAMGNGGGVRGHSEDLGVIADGRREEANRGNPSEAGVVLAGVVGAGGSEGVLGSLQRRKAVGVGIALVMERRRAKQPAVCADGNVGAGWA